MLRGVTKGEKKPPRIVLYGPPKVGKSTFGADFPAPIFATTESGIDNLTVDRFPVPEDWNGLIANLEQVAKEKHEYKTLVLDTINGAAELAASHICRTQFKGDWGKGGFLAYGQGLASTSEEMRRIIPVLDACRDRGMATLLLAHTGVQTVRNPVDGDYQRFTPDVDRRIWARFAAWADIIGRAEFEHTIQRAEDPRRPGKALGVNIRVVHFAGSAAEEAGTRVGFELPEKLALSYEAFAGALGNDSETTSEVKTLWAILTPEEIKATLVWLGVRNLEDAPPTKLRQLLNRLRQLKAQRDSQDEGEAKEATHAA